MKHTAETITCQPIDTAKINAYMDAKLLPLAKAKENVREMERAAGVGTSERITTHYKMRGPLAIVTSPILAVIDEEFCGEVLKEGDKITISAYAEGDGWFSMMPEYSLSVGINDLKSDGYLLPATTLADFTKGRRGYNSRIQGNEAEWMRTFNK